MSVMTERIEAAFMDEQNRIKHEGIGALLHARLDALLFMVYRRGYIRGHSDRSREVQQDEERAIREGRVQMGVSVKYEGDRLILGGKDVTPKREEPLPEYRPTHRPEPRRGRSDDGDPPGQE